MKSNVFVINSNGLCCLLVCIIPAEDFEDMESVSADERPKAVFLKWSASSGILS